MDFATKTLNEAFKELENLKNLASDRSSEVSKDFQDYQINAKDGLRNSYEPSEVDTEELFCVWLFYDSKAIFNFNYYLLEEI